MTERSCNDGHVPREGYVPEDGRCTEEYLACVRENYFDVCERVERVCASLGRTDGVKIVAASKTVPAEAVNYAASLGLRAFGENRVQEFCDKEPLLSPQLERHFIGSLQRNKVKYLIGRTLLIHSVDSVALAEEISKRAKRAGYVQDILVELNIGREESKSGVMPEALDGFFDRIADFDGINPLGLMTIAPKCYEKDDYRIFFAETYQILLDINAKKMHNRCVPLLSMGMSDSFELALEYGANIIRPGSAIFGKRNYNRQSGA